MADSAGCGVDFFHIGGGILFDLFSHLLILDRVGQGYHGRTGGCHRLTEDWEHFKGAETAFDSGGWILSSMLDDVERIEVDPGVREALPGDRDKAVAHFTVEEFHPFSLSQRESMEIDAGNLIYDVDDVIGVSIR